MIMAILLYQSMRRELKYLAFLEPHGLMCSTKTMYLQLICIIIISVLNMSGFVTEMKFKRECFDDVMAPSPAGVVTRVANMMALLLWRIVTLTMLLFFVRHAKTLKHSD